MTWIDTVAPEHARGLVERVYQSCERQYGFVPNIRRSMSLSPDTLRAYVQLSSAVYGGGPLPAVEREIIATAVSAINQCHY